MPDASTCRLRRTDVLGGMEIILHRLDGGWIMRGGSVTAERRMDWKAEFWNGRTSMPELTHT